ncbi:hypothetical protein GGP41_007452 [Bipolaris sorokiniana]|uniref:Secreted protein n=2 Tax=Cochliobolus sativus TaxID=45130 RepID=A0A8H5ZSL2_COCSA|nr:uncharacterized protein COCSADRAFT_290571 [Bipolaris sorokiniana ND90Pr]EMD67573.1 hypothetical protein COCSADRAFT_290571 [Bipolaris sorokiniana ND90Pr]KAF5854622.1 hypothetical protein GGP41_007452 [Bipolaris sorokiniana]
MIQRGGPMLCGLFWSCGGWRCWNICNQGEPHGGITEVVCVCRESGWQWSQMCMCSPWTCLSAYRSGILLWCTQDMASGLRDYKLARLASKGRRRLHSENDNDEFVSHQRELRCMI